MRRRDIIRIKWRWDYPFNYFSTILFHVNIWLGYQLFHGFLWGSLWVSLFSWGTLATLLEVKCSYWSGIVADYEFGFFLFYCASLFLRCNSYFNAFFICSNEKPIVSLQKSHGWCMFFDEKCHRRRHITSTSYIDCCCRQWKQSLCNIKKSVRKGNRRTFCTLTFIKFNSEIIQHNKTPKPFNFYEVSKYKNLSYSFLQYTIFCGVQRSKSSNRTFLWLKVWNTHTSMHMYKHQKDCKQAPVWPWFNGHCLSTLHAMLVLVEISDLLFLLTAMAWWTLPKRSSDGE